MTDIISGTITETLKWMNGIGDMLTGKKDTIIQYSADRDNMPLAGLRFNSEPQVSRLYPTNNNMANPIINGVKFNSD